MYKLVASSVKACEVPQDHNKYPDAKNRNKHYLFALKEAEPNTVAIKPPTINPIVRLKLDIPPPPR